ncbi:hypothetical protein GUJ93_ZPchr0012g21039 [Zizania palustris]|uniref:Uncharacterized protein n=1 Tax=Zizania palustris TaxID=103762 RepID=A0A8J5WLV8_ZIZPA|nr:hypothetical protein GUJ93_ZPchr0012g21039 [Zizania palustris]
MSSAATDTGSGDRFAVGGGRACTTSFVSAPSSPARDAPFSGGFFSAPASPARGGRSVPDAGEECGCEFEFDFSSRFPSPAAAPMSSADELFHNGQIRPMRLASFLLRAQALPAMDDVPSSKQPQAPEATGEERSRLRSRSVHRRSRSYSPFRTHWLLPSPSPAPAAGHGSESETAAVPSASRSSSSSSTASSVSSSSPRSSRRWRFLKDLLHRVRSDGSKNLPPTSPPPAAGP